MRGLFNVRVPVYIKGVLACNANNLTGVKKHLLSINRVEAITHKESREWLNWVVSSHTCMGNNSLRDSYR